MKRILLLLSVSCLIIVMPLNAALHGEMYGSAFPEAFPAGPTHNSKRYEIRVKRDNLDNAEFDLVLDTPSAANIVALGDPNVVFTVDGQEIKSPVFNGFDLSETKEVGLGRIFDMTAYEPGTYRIKARHVSQPELHVVVVQPVSPLELSAQIKPLAVQADDKTTLTVRLEDEHPITTAKVKATLANGKVILLHQKVPGHYEAAIQAPRVSGRKQIPIEVIATGTNSTGQSFIREAIVRMVVIEANSGFDGEVTATANGAVIAQIKPAKGQYRVDVIYGYQNKSIAWARQNFYMDNNGQHITIAMPEYAKAADVALVKLLNMDTLGLEDVALVQLTPDASAQANFKVPVFKEPGLPAAKRRAMPE